MSGLEKNIHGLVNIRCLLTTIADSNPANVIFGKSWSFFWIPFLFLSSHYFAHLIFVLAYFMEKLIYFNVCCCNGYNCCWVNVNKSKKMDPLVAKTEYVIINSNWMQEIMAGCKKKFRYSEETPWFPEYYFAWIGIGNCN